MNDYSQLPRRILLMVLLAILGVSTLATWYELQLPWLGLTLTSTEKDIVVTSSEAPGQSIPVGAQVIAVVSNIQRIDLQPTDLYLDPDVLDTYPQLNNFFQRQSALFTQLQSPVEVIWKTADSLEKKSLIHPQKRTLHSLPVIFWLSLIIGTTACLIGCWVWVLRRSDWGSRMFAITGVMFFATVVPIAIYISRPLALSGGIFQILSAVNHLAVITFGTALIGLFLSYPNVLVKPRTFIFAPLFFGLWWICDVTQLAPDLDWGSRLPIISEFLLAVLFSVIQWRNSRYKPAEKASLRWFLIFVLSACSLTILPFVNNVIFGYKSFISSTSIIQHPVFALSALLIMYVGIALGLSRYRLFELDEWAYRILLWVGGAVMVVLLDSAFVLLLNPDPALSLGVTLIIAGLVYFPLRQWLWLRYIAPENLTIEQVIPNIIRLAFFESTLERGRLWRDLLHTIYNSLEMSNSENSAEKTTLNDDGVEMNVRACGGLPPTLMRYPHQGNRLFSKRDVIFVDGLCQLMEYAATARTAYEQGAAQERRRISRDMHDDVGARLLMLIHRAKDEATAEIARAAVRDFRTALNSLDAKPAQLTDALADWRQEIETRCEAANVMMDWREPKNMPEYWISAVERSALERVLREILSNALKHASPTKILVETILDAELLHIAVSNDTNVTLDSNWIEGRGLLNMRARLGEIGGTLVILHNDLQDVLTLSVPFARSQTMREA